MGKAYLTLTRELYVAVGKVENIVAIAQKLKNESPLFLTVMCDLGKAMKVLDKNQKSLDSMPFGDLDLSFAEKTELRLITEAGEKAIKAFNVASFKEAVIVLAERIKILNTQGGK